MRSSTLLAAAFLGAFLTRPAAAVVQLSTDTALSGSSEFSAYDNRITGPNPSASFLTPGTHTMETLNTLLNSKTDGRMWESALDGRATDDERVDRKRFNLKRFYVKEDDERNSAVVGDYLASLSDYTLGKSLKGAQYTRKTEAGGQYTVLGGFDKPNWDDVWNHNPGETVDRQVWGARAAHTFLGDGTVGVNAVWAKDERAVGDTTDLAIDNRVASVDWTLPRYHKLTLSGESAYSVSRNSLPGTDPNTGDAISERTDPKGGAHKLRARWSYGRFKTTDDFERVDPDFQTTVGAASPDLLKLKTDNTWTIAGPWKWIVLRYTYFHNNLRGLAENNTSTTRMPETGLRYEAPDWRPDFSIETKLRARDVSSTASASVKRTRSVITSAADRFGPLSVQVDYELQKEDKTDGSVAVLHHILGVGSNALLKAGDWKFVEGLRWDLQRDRDQILGVTDQNATVKANVMAVSPWGVDSGVTYARNLVLNALTPGNDRRTWTASLGWNIMKREDQRAELRFSQNDNRFGEPDQDYKEMVWAFSLNDKF